MSQQRWVLKNQSENIASGSKRKKTPNGEFFSLHLSCILLALAFFLSACGKAPDATGGSTNLGSNQGSGKVDNGLGFAVTGVTANYGYADSLTQLISTSPASDVQAGFAAAAASGSACSVPTTAATSSPPTYNDLLCMVSVKEGDLYVHGMGIGINVPQNMCDYYWSLPYYYYALPPGTINGESYAETIDANGNITSCTNGATAGIITGSSCTFPNHEVTLNGGALTCAYDYSGSDPSLPNCCEGTYTLRVTTLSASGPPSTSTSTATYPGHMANCLRGPAMMNGWPLDKNGYPEAVILDVATVGKNYQYAVPAPISVVSNSNLLVANMFAWSHYENGTFASTFKSAPATILPTAANPSVDLSGSPIPQAHPFYEFRCQDRGFETLQRVRLMIASWTTDAQYTQYISSGTGTLNVTGAEGGGNCIGVAGPCDDELGWDDVPLGQFPGIPY